MCTGLTLNIAVHRSMFGLGSWRWLGGFTHVPTRVYLLFGCLLDDEFFINCSKPLLLHLLDLFPWFALLPLATLLVTLRDGQKRSYNAPTYDGSNQWLYLLLLLLKYFVLLCDP